MPPPETRARAAHTIATLDASIALAEQRLTAREEGLRLRWHALRRRTERAVEPQRLVLPVLGAAFAMLAGWWAWRRPPRAMRFGAPAASAEPERPAQSWLRQALMFWSLLPPAWRARLKLDRHALLEQLIRPRPFAPLSTVEGLDLSRFAGTWYELARLPTAGGDRCIGQRSLSYVLRGDELDVVQHRCATVGQPHTVTRGHARIAAGETSSARLQLSWLPAWLSGLPFAWEEHWIISVDTDYSLAMVGSPARDRLSILSRQAELPAGALQRLLAAAREAGFAVERLEFFKPD